MGFMDEVRKQIEAMRQQAQQSRFAKTLNAPIQVNRQVAQGFGNLAKATPSAIFKGGVQQQSKVFNTQIQAPKIYQQYQQKVLTPLTKLPTSQYVLGRGQTIADRAIGAVQATKQAFNPNLSTGQRYLSGAQAILSGAGAVLGATPAGMKVDALLTAPQALIKTTGQALTGQPITPGKNIMSNLTGQESLGTSLNPITRKVFGEQGGDTASMAIDVASMILGSYKGGKFDPQTKYLQSLDNIPGNWNLPRLGRTPIKPGSKTIFSPEYEAMTKLKKPIPKELIKIFAKIFDESKATGKVKPEIVPTVMDWGSKHLGDKNLSRFTPEQIITELYKHAVGPKVKVYASEIKTPKLAVEPTSQIKPGMTQEEQFSIMQKAHDTNVKAYQDWQSGKITKQKYGEIVSSNQPKPISTQPDLLTEARKYGSAEEFIKAQEKATKGFEFGDINTPQSEATRKFAEIAQKPEYQKIYEQGGNDKDVLKAIYNQAKGVAQGGLYDGPEQLRPLARNVVWGKMSKEQFLSEFNKGLKDQNLTTRETAQKTLAEMKKAGLTPESFYDRYGSSATRIAELEKKMSRSTGNPQQYEAYRKEWDDLRSVYNRTPEEMRVAQKALDQSLSPTGGVGDIKPITAYHGTNAKFDNFDFKKTGLASGEKPLHGLEGAWFTTDKGVASGYGKNIKQANIDTSNFYTVDAKGATLNDFRDQLWDAKKYVKDNNKSGLIVKNLVDNADWSKQDIADHIFVVDKKAINQSLSPTGGARGVNDIPSLSTQRAARFGPISPPQVAPSTTGTQKLTQSLQGQKMSGGAPPTPPGSSGSIIPPKGLPEGDPVKRITEALLGAKPIRGQQEAIYKKIRSQQAGALSGISSRQAGESGYFQKLGQLKGAMPKVQFESIRKQVSQSDIDHVFNLVEKSNLTEFEKVTAQTGLKKLVAGEGGTVPTEGELKLLNEVFPPEFIEAVLQNRSSFQKLFSGVQGALNLPRAIMATADLSAPLRQGIFMIGRPKQFVPAFKEMFKYAFSQKAYDGLQEQIKSRPSHKLMREAKLAITDMGPQLSTREEAFMSGLAEKIPGFGAIAKGSNRAYSGFLTKLRADVFDDLIAKAGKQGIQMEGKALSDLGSFINAATGRGNLPKALERAAPLLNSTFFSPRLMASRLNLLNPVYYAKLDPFVRKEAVKSLLGFATTATTVLTLAKLGGAEVGADPRSADFGKIKVGNTRYDVLGGFQQYIRLGAQLLTGKIISSESGKEITLGEGYKPLTRWSIAGRFLETKEAPILSFASALLKGQSAMGEPLNVPAEAYSRLIPLVVQDIYDIAKDRDSVGQALVMALPGLFGVGSQTYGKKELVTGQNAVGQQTAQIRPLPDLASTLAEKTFGPRPLGSTSSWNAEVYMDQLRKMPTEQKKASWGTISKYNPELKKKMEKIGKDRAKGVTIQDEQLKSKGVASGERAIAIAKILNKAKTKEERNKLYLDYVRKGVITDAVAKQLPKLLKTY